MIFNSFGFFFFFCNLNFNKLSLRASTGRWLKMTQTRSIRETTIVIRENINWWIVIKGFLTLIKYR
jgi:hypothetical protein